MSAAKLAVENVIAQIEAWHGISVSMQEAGAIAAEAAAYGKIIKGPLRELLFDDQPSDLVHSLEGRRGWRGHAR
jgi:hypothetical protein